MGQPSDKNIEDIYPLAPMQRGILFHDLLSAGSERLYVQQVLWRMDAGVDLPELRRAWEHVVARHPIFRTFVIWENRPDPIQVVCRQAVLPWAEIGWRGMAQREIEPALEALLAADRAEGFVLNRAPLMRLSAIHLPDGGVQMIWTFHHLLIDGWCLPLIFTEVMAAYEAFRNGVEMLVTPATPYRRFIDWLARRDDTNDRAFWTGLLAGFGGPTAVPGDAQGGRDVARQASVRRLSRAETEAVNALCAHRHLTVSVAVQVAWAILLSALAREPDVVFGLTVAGRPPELPDAENIAGLFINSVPVRLNVDGATPVLRLLRSAMEQQTARDGHLHASLSQMKSWAGLSGDASLFDSLLVFENYPIDRMVAATGARLGITDLRVIDATNFPVTLIVTPGDTMELKLLHDRARLSGAEADRLLQSLSCILAGMAADCERPLCDLPLVDVPERGRLIDHGKGPDRDWGRSELLHRLVEEQAARTPAAIAVRFSGQDLSYRELDCRANQLAHLLRRHGVGPDRMVGIAMYRSIEMVVGLLGILKAGGAYLPIDPAAPAERLAFMVADADVPALLVHSAVAARLPPHGARTICLDADWTAVASQPETPPQDVDVGPDHLAYVIYTSGSTGTPKGAMNTHRAICNRLLWMQEEYRLEADDRVLQKTPCSFDVSVWEFFWPLLTGARLVVAEPDGHHDPAYLSRLIREEQITTLHFVPSMLQLFLEQEGIEASCVSLRRTICSGEALPPGVVNRFFSRLPGELHNLYGPAEAAIDVTFWQCRPDPDATTVPIGRPIANLSLLLLDPNGRFVPRGTAGELYIGGVGVGRGYHNRPKLTAEKFMTSPLAGASDARLYRTGDLARWREDGALEFLGRCDNQVKLRGMRIDPGEIETVLRTASGVQDAVVVLERGAAGQDQLIGYITTAHGSSIASADILDSMRTRLPGYMIPSRLVRLERLPLSPNGKLDRKALPTPASVRPAAGPATQPRSALERTVADVWRDVLMIEAVGLRDNFFELGGTSLLVVPVHTRLRDSCDPSLSLVEMFQYPTVEALARRLGRAAGAVEPAASAEIQRTVGAEGIRRQAGLRARREAARADRSPMNGA